MKRFLLTHFVTIGMPLEKLVSEGKIDGIERERRGEVHLEAGRNWLVKAIPCKT